MEIQTRNVRGLLVAAGVLVWVVGLLWVLTKKGVIDAPVFTSATSFANDDEESARRRTSGDDEITVHAPVDEELIIVAPREQAKPAGPAVAVAETPVEELPVEDAGPPTYPVWFESERSIGVCKVTYEGGSKLANLHVSTRLPEGKLAFSYTCGKYSGRGSIDVKPKRVNGVLFCQKAGSVTVKTVRSKDGRCDR